MEPEDTKTIEELEELQQKQEDLAELQDILDRMLDDSNRAFELYVEMGGHEERAKAYWFAQIRMALNSDHSWVGSGSVTLENAIAELDGSGEE